MYLSKLVLNPTSRRVRTESGRPYELHRTLMRAFPSAEEGTGRVLFRLDMSKESNSIALLVQSEKEPDWRPLDEVEGFSLGACPIQALLSGFSITVSLAVFACGPTRPSNGKGNALES